MVIIPRKQTEPMVAGTGLCQLDPVPVLLGLIKFESFLRNVVDIRQGGGL